MNKSRQNPFGGLMQQLQREAQAAEAIGNKQLIEFPGMPVPTFYLAPNTSKTSDEGAKLLDDMERKHASAIQTVGEQLEDYLKMMMGASWGWTSGARDIIDTGALMNSGSVKVTSNGIDVTYSSPYASFVHYGGYIHPYGNVSIDKRYIPGRPWISATFGEANGPLPAFDWQQVYRDAMR